MELTWFTRMDEFLAAGGVEDRSGGVEDGSFSRGGTGGVEEETDSSNCRTISEHLTIRGRRGSQVASRFG